MCAGDPVGGLSCIASCTDTEQMKRGILDSDVCGGHNKSEKSEECWIWR